MVRVYGMMLAGRVSKSLGALEGTFCDGAVVMLL